MFQFDLGHNSEQSIAHYSSRPTVSQLSGFSDTISDCNKKHQPQRTQSGIEWTQPQVFRAHSFNSCNIQGKSKLFSSQGNSNGKKLP